MDKQANILALKALVQEDAFLQTKFPYDLEEYLERFLKGTDFDVDRALDRIKLYYEASTEYPDWFRTFPPIDLKNLIESNIRVGLPETDKEGRPIYIVKLGNVKPTEMMLPDIAALDDAWLEYIILNSGPEKGICVLIDVADAPWRSLKWLTPHNLKIFIRKFLSLPFKDYRFHVVKKHFIVYAATKLIWPFLPEELKDRVHFHFDDWISLHNHIDVDSLPREYGGANGEIDFPKLNGNLYAQNDRIYDSFKKYRK